MKSPGKLLWLTFFLLICTYPGTAQLPIKPVRTISFSSNESSYTDVDVSPDGKALLVSFWGQLYSLPITGGPDGKRLVFSALSRIYTMDLPNGKPKPLVDQAVNQFEPVYSPDGKWITYVSWDDKEGGQLWRIAVQNGIPEQLTSVAGLYMHPSWSPDGNRIVVAKGRNRLGYRDHPGNGQIIVVSMRDKSVQVIADTVPLWNNPVFLNDGKHIAYTPKQEETDGKIWPRLVSYDPDNNRNNVLLSARNADEKYSPIQQVVLSPNGKYVVFSFNQDLYLSTMSNPGIDTSQLIFDYREPIPVIRFARGAIDPVWNASGKTVSWTAVNRYCSIDADKIINAAKTLTPNAVLKELPETKIIDVDIAEGLGMQKDLGSIEVGKMADLIVLDKDPLEDIHNTISIKYVMKAGVLYESESLDEVWPGKKKGPTDWR